MPKRKAESYAAPSKRQKGETKREPTSSSSSLQGKSVYAVVERKDQVDFESQKPKSRAVMKKSGEMLGIFDTLEKANKFARKQIKEDSCADSCKSETDEEGKVYIEVRYNMLFYEQAVYFNVERYTIQ